MAIYDKFKHKQHYVWRSYLEAWSQNEQLICLRQGEIFTANIKDLAQKRDFYKSKELNHKEIDILFAFIKTFPPHLQELQKQIVDVFTTPHRLKAIIINSERSQNNEDASGTIKTLDIMINNIEEEIHSDIESNSYHFIKSLKSGNTSFWNIQDSKLNFLHFICLQMLRTKKIQENLYRTIDQKMPETPELKNIWGVMRHLTAMNVADSILGDKDYNLRLLANNSKTPFITSDQPVINTFSHGFNPEVTPEKFEIFYPISPKTGVLIGTTNNYSSNIFTELAECDVKHYNDLIFKSSHEHVYSGSIEILEAYRKEI